MKDALTVTTIVVLIIVLLLLFIYFLKNNDETPDNEALKKKLDTTINNISENADLDKEDVQDVLNDATDSGATDSDALDLKECNLNAIDGSCPDGFIVNEITQCCIQDINTDEDDTPLSPADIVSFIDDIKYQIAAGYLLEMGAATLAKKFASRQARKTFAKQLAKQGVSAFTAAAQKSIREAGEQAAKKAAKKFGRAFGAFELLSIALDIWDPYRYNSHVDRKDIEKERNIMEYAFINHQQTPPPYVYELVEYPGLEEKYNEAYASAYSDIELTILEDQTKFDSPVKKLVDDYTNGDYTAEQFNDELKQTLFDESIKEPYKSQMLEKTYDYLIKNNEYFVGNLKMENIIKYDKQLIGITQGGLYFTEAFVKYYNDTNKEKIYNHEITMLVFTDKYRALDKPITEQDPKNPSLKTETFVRKVAMNTSINPIYTLCTKPREGGNKVSINMEELATFNQDTGLCDYSEEYCSEMGLDYSSSDNSCKSRPGQYIAEMLFGTTATRAVLKAFFATEKFFASTLAGCSGGVRGAFKCRCPGGTCASGLTQRSNSKLCLGGSGKLCIKPPDQTVRFTLGKGKQVLRSVTSYYDYGQEASFNQWSLVGFRDVPVYYNGYIRVQFYTHTTQTFYFRSSIFKDKNITEVNLSYTTYPRRSVIFYSGNRVVYDFESARGKRAITDSSDSDCKNYKLTSPSEEFNTLQELEDANEIKEIMEYIYATANKSNEMAISLAENGIESTPAFKSVFDTLESQLLDIIKRVDEKRAQINNSSGDVNKNDLNVCIKLRREIDDNNAKFIALNSSYEIYKEVRDKLKYVYNMYIDLRNVHYVNYINKRGRGGSYVDGALEIGSAHFIDKEFHNINEPWYGAIADVNKELNVIHENIVGLFQELYSDNIENYSIYMINWKIDIVYKYMKELKYELVRPDISPEQDYDQDGYAEYLSNLRNEITSKQYN